MKVIPILWATLFFACNNVAPTGVFTGSGSAVNTFEPTSIISAHIHPANLTLLFVPGPTCTSAISTKFDLVVASTGSAAVFLDNVTFRLIDGSSLGGPMLGFPRPALDAMFGSTLVTGRRSFAFHPFFGCRGIRPKSIHADVVLVAKDGSFRTATGTATFP